LNVGLVVVIIYACVNWFLSLSICSIDTYVNYRRHVIL